jgi:hypothetical protein
MRTTPKIFILMMALASMLGIIRTSHAQTTSTDAPPFGFIERSAPDPITLVQLDGSRSISHDAGMTWQPEYGSKSDGGLPRGGAKRVRTIYYIKPDGSRYVSYNGAQTFWRAEPAQQRYSPISNLQAQSKTVPVYHPASSATLQSAQVLLSIPEVLSITPNPTSGVTTIKFNVPSAERITLVLFDARGAEVLRLVDDILPAGDQVAKFDTRSLKSGLYNYELSGAHSRSSGNIVVVH